MALGATVICRQQLAFEAEQHMIPMDEWDDHDIPQEAIDAANKEMKTGMSTGIAKHPLLGWMVSVTAGQGPTIVWDESPPRKTITTRKFTRREPLF